MKKTNFFHLLLMMVIGIGFLSSCGSDDDDDVVKTDISTLNLTSSQGASATFSIHSNTSWVISGQDSWLLLSTTSGNKDATVVVTAKNNNDDDEARICSLIITAGKATSIVTVSQEGGLISCKVTPANITPLYYGVAFDLQYTSNVATCKLLTISDYDMKHNTESQLIALIESQTNAIPEDETVYTKSIDVNDEGEKYHILSIAYDTKGNRGKMGDVEFTVPFFADSDDDAWCYIDNLTASNNSFSFSITKVGRCEKYHLIYGTNVPTDYIKGLLMAFEINYYIKNNQKHWLTNSWGLNIQLDYPNDHVFSCQLDRTKPYGGCFAAAWGIFSNGNLSSDLQIRGGNAYSNSVTGSTSKCKEIPKDCPNGWAIYTPYGVRYN